ncbi:M20 family metallopeptidase [Paenarthrobacter sp. NPDC057981]|uniref:M20 metallopeptidase family protein n=1 Tax=Paenarthrobacter sp. NPDC057981 TaxID=3346297 RepID=UPI0036DDF014
MPEIRGPVTSPDLNALLQSVEHEVLQWRRHFHAYPELSFSEHETSAKIADVLHRKGLTFSMPTPTSVVVEIAGGLPGRTVAIRADIDALPITEQTGLAFSSKNPRAMHACGHDGHIAVGLGIAGVLAQLRGKFAGNVRIIFQHAEEQMPKGAPELIEAGVLDGVDVVLGQHFVVDAPVGTVTINRGALLASADLFHVRLEGLGGHGGLPHQTKDPIPATADFIHAVHRIASREFPPSDPVIISVTQLEAGDAYNVIPPEAHLKGTVRALSPSARQKVTERLFETARGIAATHGITANLTYEQGPPPLINTIKVADFMRDVAEECNLIQRVQEIAPLMGADDYSYYLDNVPGVYILTGADPQQNGGPAYPPHHPGFDFNESALPVATGLLLRGALALAAAPS